MKLKILLSSVALGSLLTASAVAAPIVFDFSPAPPPGAFGTSQVFTSGAYSLTAYGFITATGAATNLYHKYTVGDPAETGLGIAADGDHEIPPQYFVQLDVQNLIDAGFSTLTFKLGSLQAGEEANIFGDTTLGTFGDGSLLSTLTGAPLEQTISLALTSRYFNITGGGGSGADPVLESAWVNSVPDSGATVLLLGAALLVVAAIRNRRIRRTTKSVV